MSHLLSNVCESYLGNREAISAVVVSVSHVFSVVLASFWYPEKKATYGTPGNEQGEVKQRNEVEGGIKWEGQTRAYLK